MQEKEVNMISIILSVYNGDQWLEKSLDSIYNQTYKNFEVVCVNDGSTDDTDKICRKYQENHSNFQYITQENHGLAYSRNVGVEQAQGDYLTFVDADDLIADEMLEYMNSLIVRYRVSVAYTKLLPFTDENHIKKHDIIKETVCDTKASIKKYFKEKSGNVCAGIFKKSLFDDIRFIEGMIYEDNLPKLKLLMKASKVVFSSAEMYYYRCTEDSITREKANCRNFDILKIGYLQEQLMQREIPYIYKKVKSAHIEMIAGILYWNLIQFYKEGSVPTIRWEDYAPLEYINKVLTKGLCHGFKDRIRAYFYIKKYVK